MITDNIEKIGNVDVEVEKVLGKDQNGVKWELIVKNQSTGEEVIHYHDIKGGVLVVAQTKPSEIEAGGTRQGIFGAMPEVMICYYKSKYILKQTLKKYLGVKFDELEKFDAYKNL